MEIHGVFRWDLAEYIMVMKYMSNSCWIHYYVEGIPPNQNRQVCESGVVSSHIAYTQSILSSNPIQSSLFQCFLSI